MPLRKPLNKAIETRNRWSLSDTVRDTYDAGEEFPWWLDNSAHLTAGFLLAAALNYVLPAVLVVVAYFVAAGAWELYEYRRGIRPWDPLEAWTYDRAMEDTVLDSLMGLAGVLVFLVLVGDLVVVIG